MIWIQGRNMHNHHPKLFPICPLCNEPVELETSNINESGEAVHEECYVLTIKGGPTQANRSLRTMLRCHENQE
jgi:hypothetical protein